MPIQSQAQLDAFKNVALSQGYAPEEVEAFMGMATAANSAKQVEEETAKSDELRMYEDKLKLQNQYNPPAADKPFDPATDAVLQRQLYLDKIATQEGGNGKVLGYVDQLENGTSKSIKDIPAEDRGDVVKYLKDNNIDVYTIQKQREGSAATALIKGLFNDYYGGNGRGQGDDLSGKGLPGLGLSGLLIKGRALTGFGKAANYKATKKALIASLKSITGDTGILTDQDADRINGLMPNEGANPEYAQRQWEKINQIIKDKYGAGFLPETPEEPAKPGMLGGNKSTGMDQADMDLINKYKK